VNDYWNGFAFGMTVGMGAGFVLAGGFVVCVGRMIVRNAGLDRRVADHLGAVRDAVDAPPTGDSTVTFRVRGLTGMDYERVELTGFAGPLIKVRQFNKPLGQIGTVVIEQVHPADVPMIRSIMGLGESDAYEWETP
jgi:hypothetical protein